MRGRETAWQYYDIQKKKSIKKEANEHPVLIHYLNELYIRPWFCNSDHPYRKEYEKYDAKICEGQHLKTGKKGRLKVRTRILRLLYTWLPFALFVKIYWFVKRRE